MNNSTPTGVRIIATAPDGTERNITEGVQALYDFLIQSLDWGSHFLSVEDVDPIVALVRFCGFKNLEEAEEYVEEERRKEKQANCKHEHLRTEEPERRWFGLYVKSICDECGYEQIKPLDVAGERNDVVE